uniref:Iron-sulfur cluster assembly SufBD family protein ycf24 n=1 Tax=Tolypiocladia glomerulata TaxID=860646 RepID=A0A1Z1MV27_9FLOR|nr:Iron-sulfur cluster assembly protein SufB [Tolypiocladia glomerulata]ARW69729.1 Iron-sulfur cluster assembly protein SufB [Tolypiocladia glomerulata]
MYDNIDTDKTNSYLDNLINEPYKYGFHTQIESEYFPKGLSAKIIKLISKIKQEPYYLTNFRLNAYEKWIHMREPQWSNIIYNSINYNKILYYSIPKNKKKLQSLDQVDPEILETFNKLGISLDEQKRISNVAVDAVFDSVSITTTFKQELASYGVIFCSITEAIKLYPNLIKKYLSSVIPDGDNFYSSLNSATFSDGSFCYIPPNTKCPLELSTYFRINNKDSGQFERTLIIADKNSYVSYLEGCTAPQFDNNQLHAAVVELIALDNATIKYSTVQNWYAGDSEGRGGIYNFVTKRGICAGKNAKIFWTQVETGSSVTWKYPSCVLLGPYSIGEFSSIALTNNFQQADTGSKMIHIGNNTRSKIISKGISAGKSINNYRGLVKISPRACHSRNYSQCDSLILSDKSQANTFPYIQVKNPQCKVEHEASTSRIGEEQIFYFMQRGISAEEAVSLMINGFCKDILNELPMEFAMEADRLLNLKLEGTIG